MRIFAFLHLAGRFTVNRGGNFASIFAIIAPIFLGAVGGAVDLVVFNRQESKMQDAVDSAVLAATREAALQNWGQEKANAVAQSYLEVALKDAGLSSTAAFLATTVTDQAKREVTLTLDMDQHRYFVLGYFRQNPQIRVSASARMSGKTPICVLTLDPALAKSVNVIDSASVQANGCATHSNSVDKSGIYVATKASLKSAFTCSSGGFGVSASSFTPVPTTDCPPFMDPLADRPQPVVGKCDFTALNIKSTETTLKPGVYCKGLTIDNEAIVHLEPGVYIINGGTLLTRNDGKLLGDGVTIYFTGKDGRLLLDGTTTVNLTAPETGPTAGLLFMQDRDMAYTDFEISAKSATELLGTIYLPNGRLKLNAPGNISESSAFTVVVVRALEVAKKTKMFLNSDYGSTDVPVPDGIIPSQKIVLVN